MVLISILFYALVPIVAVIYWYFNRKFQYFKDRNIPHVEPSFPMGNLTGMGRERHMFDVVRDVYDKCRGKDVIAGIYNMTQPIYLIMDLDIIKDVVIRDFNNFINRGGYVNEKDEPLSGHLFAIGGEKWRFLRNKLSPVFTSGKIKGMYYTISDKGQVLVNSIDKALKSGKSVQVKEVTNRFTIDVISSVAFGMESNTMNDEHLELVKFFKEIFDFVNFSVIKFFFMLSFPKLAKTLKMRLFSKAMSDFFMNIVGGNMEQREKSNDNRQDFLNMLIQLKNKGSIDGEFSTETRKITFGEAMAQAFVFFFAGSDSSSTTISMALAELANNIDVQDRLRAEIIEKTKETKGEITYENIQEMTYLNQVVNETLRMYTNALVLIRESSEDYKISNSKHIIPKGAQLWIPMIGIHFDEKYWKNPEKFDPERFTPEEIAKRPTYAYLPFGDGPRNCIGMRFAQILVKFGLATAIRNFKVTPDKRMRYPIKFNPKNPLMEPQGGYWVNFEKITQ